MNYTKKLVDKRGTSYGSPLHGFNQIKQSYKLWYNFYTFSMADKTTAEESLSSVVEESLQHAVYMIMVKLSRIAVTIDHQDSWEDIAGYVECAKRCMEK